MDSETMQRDEKEIRRKMARARNNLAEKIAVLENEVSGTVEKVKDTVKDIKDFFDIREQVERRPWTMVLGAVGVGCVLGRLLPAAGAAVMSLADMEPGHEFHNGKHAAMESPPESPSWSAQIVGKIQPELEQLKGLALGTAFGIVRDVVTPLLPEQISSQFGGIMDSITEKLGGTPVNIQEEDEEFVGHSAD